MINEPLQSGAATARRKQDDGDEDSTERTRGFESETEHARPEATKMPALPRTGVLRAIPG